MYIGPIVLLCFPILAQSASFICSDQNTGSSFSYVYNMYQSEGACGVTCADYAFAVLQSSRCWCSNYFPAATVSNSQCNTTCPGYDTDICGGTLNGVYAYYQLAQASGTASASTSGVSSTSTSPTSSSSTSSSPSTLSTSTSTTGTSKSSTTTSAGTTAAPVTVVVTQTATPTPSTPSTSATEGSSTSTITSSGTSSGATALQTGTSTQSLQAQKSSGFFSDAGKVAGTFVAVGLVVLALLGLLIFLLVRQRRRQRSEAAIAAALDRKASSASTFEDAPDNRARSESARGLVGYNSREPGGGNSPPIINWPLKTAEIVPVDQRLNPHPIMMRFDSNYSRHSLRDDEDYSRRVLQVANPSLHD